MKSQVRISADEEAFLFETCLEKESQGSTAHQPSISEHRITEHDLLSLFSGVLDDDAELLDSKKRFEIETKELLETICTSIRSVTELDQNMEGNKYDNNVIQLQVTFNRMPRAAHILLPIVKKALQNENVKAAIESVRQTCKFYRMSSVCASTLEKL